MERRSPGTPSVVSTTGNTQRTFRTFLVLADSLEPCRVQCVPFTLWLPPRIPLPSAIPSIAGNLAARENSVLLAGEIATGGGHGGYDIPFSFCSRPASCAGKKKHGRRDEDGKRTRGVRRYFAVDAAGSIAWRAEELVERETKRGGTERDRDWREPVCTRVRERDGAAGGWLKNEEVAWT